MQAFDYARPRTPEAALKLLDREWGSTELLAGGTDLLTRMKDDVSVPRRLVSLKAVAGLNGIEYHPGRGLRLGAMTTLEEVREHAAVAQHYPGLIQAIEGVSSPQIRNMGTIAGDLCQRPRCWYYRNGYGLLGQLNGKSLVLEGDNRYHAILGNEGPAYFVNPSSLAPILMAHGARIRILGPKGQREVAAEEFFRIPGSEHERENVLQPNELITEISVPAPAAGTHSAVYEVRQKEALDWPLTAAAVVLQMHGSTVRQARVVLGHVAPKPWPAFAAEHLLAGKPVHEETADAAGKAAVEGARALSKNAYKIQLARVAVKRALLRAVNAGV